MPGVGDEGGILRADGRFQSYVHRPCRQIPLVAMGPHATTSREGKREAAAGLLRPRFRNDWRPSRSSASGVCLCYEIIANDQRV